ncbi:hypothetical protein GWI33_010397 [Rhynchophorus ferrugineus]|uniref:Uncharacterized protein n=1 Tax=Rhynchophorus ferrugineus TaxID=354439 RepID=A0A834ISN1_RHYFE|nr:hypothetical protein GWI33_010397 [Rhynchophorus ferrugineus]
MSRLSDLTPDSVDIQALSATDIPSSPVTHRGGGGDLLLGEPKNRGAACWCPVASASGYGDARVSCSSFIYLKITCHGDEKSKAFYDHIDRFSTIRKNVPRRGSVSPEGGGSPSRGYKRFRKIFDFSLKRVEVPDAVPCLDPGPFENRHERSQTERTEALGGHRICLSAFPARRGKLKKEPGV